MQIKNLVAMIKGLYKNLDLNCFNEPDEDVSIKILSLYHKIDEENTAENLKTIIRFASYYPDLKNVEKKDHYKIISSQNMFSKVAKKLLVKLHYKDEIDLVESLETVSGADLYEGNLLGNVFFNEESKLIKVEKIYGKKTDSSKTFIYREFNKDGVLGENKESLNFNDKDKFIYVGNIKNK